LSHAADAFTPKRAIRIGAATDNSMRCAIELKKATTLDIGI